MKSGCDSEPFCARLDAVRLKNAGRSRLHRKGLHPAAHVPLPIPSALAGSNLAGDELSNLIQKFVTPQLLQQEQSQAPQP